jgi:hypothetical protein
MNKLLILLSGTFLFQVSVAISLGDTLNEEIASKANTSNSVTKLIKTSSKTLTFQSTSTHGKIIYQVNKNTNQVYSIRWQDKKAFKPQDILGSKYFAEFQQAKKRKALLRGLEVNDGNLSFSQFGSMLSGIQGAAAVQSLTP